MTTIYLISNNLFIDNLMIYKSFTNLDDKRRQRPLTTDGEKVALTIAKKKFINDLDAIYSSTFFSSIDSAKYIIEKNEQDLIIEKRFDYRKVGNLTDSSLNLRNLQEHDFSYKLPSGESLNDVKRRMTDAVKELIKMHGDSSIAVFTHNIPIISLLSVWCEKGFNYEEKLILEYNDKVIVDGFRTDYNIIKLEFDGETIKDISKLS